MNRIHALVLSFFLASFNFNIALASTSVEIVNAGFENTGGWPGGNAGFWNINTTPSGGACAPCWTVPAAPEGNQIAFVSAAPLPGSSGFMSQVLSTALEENTVYTLSGQVGHPIGFGTTPNPDTIFTVKLLAGDNLLASISGTGPEGSFAPFEVVFDSAGSSYIGQLLQIRLESTQPQTGFDAIRLDAATVPLPSAFWLFSSALGGFSLIRHRQSSKIRMR